MPKCSGFGRLLGKKCNGEVVAFGPDFGVFWANIWCNIFAFLVQKTAGEVVGSACWLPDSFGYRRTSGAKL